MFKKVLIGVIAGGLLSPVGLALSHTGGKGLGPRGSTTHCSTKARAAGGSHPRCVVTVTSTYTKYKTVYRPVTTTKTTNHTTTSTKRVTYTSTENVFSSTLKTVTERTTTTLPQLTYYVTGDTTTTVNEGSTATETETDSETVATTTTVTETKTKTEIVVIGGSTATTEN